jgi:hypothetical protein
MRLIAGLVVIAIGAGVFALPYWLPEVAEVTVAPEAYAMAGQVGGAIMGLGVVAMVIGAFRRRR